MRYREVEYTVVQGIERQLWKWSFSLEGLFLRGEAATKAEAVTGAERAIDRALARKNGKARSPRGRLIDRAGKGNHYLNFRF